MTYATEAVEGGTPLGMRILSPLPSSAGTPNWGLRLNPREPTGQYAERMRFPLTAVMVTLTAASLLLVGCASPAIGAPASVAPASVAPASVVPETATPKPTRTTFTAHGFVFVALSEEQRMADAEELVRSMHEDPENWQRDLGKANDCVSALGFDD